MFAKILCLFPLLLALPSAPAASSWDAQTEEEALFLRRIADFWQEGEYQIVKKQIEEFLQNYPESSFAQTLHSILGDLYIREKNFKGALMQYTRLTSPELMDRTFPNRMQCLLELQWFATLADECETYLQRTNISQDQSLKATYLLAVALYQQCLNTPPQSELLQELASRALVHFQVLLQSPFARDISQGYAHLCCILKEFRKAAEIYLLLSKDESQNQDEMLFQAALLQARYDKNEAIATFNQIIQHAAHRSQDAMYNKMILSFDCGLFEELIAQKKEILEKIPPASQPLAHFFLGRSHLELQHYPEALEELLAYADTAKQPTETIHCALLDILNASHRLGDEPTLKRALDRFSEAFPNDPQVSKGILSHALLLKKQQRLEEASKKLEDLALKFPNAKELESAIFERLHLEHQLKNWSVCRTLSKNYLDKFAKGEYSTYAWRILASSSTHLAKEQTDASLKQQLISDLESLLANTPLFSLEELSDWQFLLAKTCYELHDYSKAIQILENTLAPGADFTQKANSTLLLALCYRDATSSYEQFCTKAEDALTLGADLLNKASLHKALFNGYLAQNPHDCLEKAAHHLYQASKLQPIESEHLLWLADYYYAQFLKEPTDLISVERAAETIERFLLSTGIDPSALDEGSLSFETPLVRLAELMNVQGRKDAQATLLSSLKKQQEDHPSWNWTEENKVNLLLAQNYASSGNYEQALALFDRIVANNPTLRTFTSACACLEGARLRIANWIKNHALATNPECTKTLSQLKNLMLQRSLANEPIHLEAAIEYIDLQTALVDSETRIQKRLYLLSKTKDEFEATDDLLSQDYQKSRAILIDKDRLYRSYLHYFEGEILLCKSLLSPEESEKNLLQKRAKEFYQELTASCTTMFLINRAQKQLETLSP